MEPGAEGIAVPLSRVASCAKGVIVLSARVAHGSGHVEALEAALLPSFRGLGGECEEFRADGLGLGVLLQPAFSPCCVRIPLLRFAFGSEGEACPLSRFALSSVCRVGSVVIVSALPRLFKGGP